MRRTLEAAMVVVPLTNAGTITRPAQRPTGLYGDKGPGEELSFQMPPSPWCPVLSTQAGGLSWNIGGWWFRGWKLGKASYS